MKFMMNSEVEECLFAIGEPKLHGGMCKRLSTIYGKVLGIFPDLEAARPRSTSGIQALCSLHMALEKTKNLLQHCAECSKLYLAITGDSIVVKFEKARSALQDSLRQVENVVPQSIGSQIADIFHEVEGIEFALDPLEKQVGDDIIGLLQQGKNFNSNNSDTSQLETFHQAASKLGITSSRPSLRERRALKKLVEKARVEEDKKKESIVAFLLHLLRKYSKLFKSEFSDDNDSQGSTPCSPTVQGSFDAFSKPSSINFKPNFRKSGQLPVPPEGLRCPISLQLMYDPVIIASGQTYEQVCIEKWFNDGHNTCPKTQQQLSHLGLTPNCCVKGLVSSWCEHNGVPVLDAPPDSVDSDYWRLALDKNESANSKLMESIGSYKFNSVNVVPLEKSGIIEEVEGEEGEEMSGHIDEVEVDAFERFKDFLTVLDLEVHLRRKYKVVEQIRHLLKDDEEARSYMGANGFVEALVWFFELAVHERNKAAQETGAMALYNIAVDNDRNKELMLGAGILPLLEEMIGTSNSHRSITALYFNLSCLEEAKPIIGSSKATRFLVNILEVETDPQCKLDSLQTLHNLSCTPSNSSHLISAGIVKGLQILLMDVVTTGDHAWTEKTIAIFMNLVLCNLGRDEIVSTPGVISLLSAILEVGEPVEQEQAAACLLILCTGNEKCSQMVLQEGVIPSLVSISVNGTIRGKKAKKLLNLFREQRQRDPPVVQIVQRPESSAIAGMACKEPKPLSKSTSRRNKGRERSFWWKNKSFSSVYQC